MLRLASSFSQISSRSASNTRLVWKNCAPGVDLLVLAERLEARLGGKGRGRRAEEDLGRELDLAPVQVLALVAHPAQDPQHLDRVEVDDVHAATRRRAPCVMLSPDRHRMLRTPSAVAPITSDCRPTRVRSRAAICITGSAPFCDGEHAARPAGHARRGRGVIGEVDGRHIGLDQVDVAAQLLRRRGQRRRDLGRHHELAGLQAALQLGDRLACTRAHDTSASPCHQSGWRTGRKTDIPGRGAPGCVSDISPPTNFSTPTFRTCCTHVAPGFRADLVPVQRRAGLPAASPDGPS